MELPVARLDSPTALFQRAYEPSCTVFSIMHKIFCLKCLSCMQTSLGGLSGFGEGCSNCGFTILSKLSPASVAYGEQTAQPQKRAKPSFSCIWRANCPAAEAG